MDTLYNEMNQTSVLAPIPETVKRDDSNIGHISTLKEEEHLSTTDPKIFPVPSSYSYSPEHDPKSKKKYSVITPADRQKLLDLVMKKKVKIREAAKLCNLKFSTSKAILATFRKEGRVGKKKTRSRKTKIINTLIVAEVNPFDPRLTKIIPMMSMSETRMLPNIHPPYPESTSQKEADSTKGITEVLDGAKNTELPDSWKNMLDVAVYNSRMNLLNEVQNLVLKLNLSAGSQNPSLIYLQNTLHMMSIMSKNNLDSLLCKRKPLTSLNPSPVQLPSVTSQMGTLPSFLNVSNLLKPSFLPPVPPSNTATAPRLPAGPIGRSL